MEFTVSYRGCCFSCRKMGEGPALLLIHGVACDRDYFSAAMQILSEHFTVITYDRRGYSRSILTDETSGQPEEEKRFTAFAQADDALAILRSVTDEPVYVAGISAGGVVGTALAVAHPEAVRGLVLYEPPLSLTEEARSQTDLLLVSLQTAAGKNRVVSGFASFAKTLGGVDSRAAGKEMGQLSRNITNLRMFMYHECEDFLTLTDRLPHPVQIPKLLGIGAGTLDGEGLFHLCAVEAASALGCPLWMQEGYHNLAEERPQQFAQWLTMVLKEQE